MAKITCWDFTLKWVEGIDENKVAAQLQEIAKGHSTFQLEEGLGGYKHWQGRISTKKQYRENEIHKIGKQENFLYQIHWSITSNANKGNMDYCTKDFTRIKGPWEIKSLNRKMTLQMEWFFKQELRPWQSQLKKLIEPFDMRSIHLIYDPIGCNGKSLFIEYMEWHDCIYEMPPYRLMDDIFQWVAGIGGRKAFAVDLPRGMKKDKLGDFYSGIEVIKNGVAFDKRYNPTKIRFNRPNIVVFTNELPCLDLMSMDRWVLWTIDLDFELIKFKPDF